MRNTPTQGRELTMNKAATLKSIVNNPDFIESMRQIAPKYMNVERLVKLCLVTASRNPKIYDCTKASILGAMMTAAEFGLECSGATGEAYLIPYKNKAGVLELQFQPGYKGLRKLAKRQNKALKNPKSVVVYKNDVLIYKEGDNPSIEHQIPNPFDRGEMVGVYAIAEFSDGSRLVEVMSRADVDKIRKRSRAANDGPWVTDYSEMARKTVLKRLCKHIGPDGEDDLLARALDLDNEEFRGGEGAAGSRGSAAATLFENLSVGAGSVEEIEVEAEAVNMEAEGVIPEPPTEPEPPPERKARPATNKGPAPAEKPAGDKKIPNGIPDEARFKKIKADAFALGVDEAVIVKSIKAPPSEWGESEIDDIAFGLHQVSEGMVPEEVFQVAS